MNYAIFWITLIMKNITHVNPWKMSQQLLCISYRLSFEKKSVAITGSLTLSSKTVMTNYITSQLAYGIVTTTQQKHKQQHQFKLECEKHLRSLSSSQTNHTIGIGCDLCCSHAVVTVFVVINARLVVLLLWKDVSIVWLMMDSENTEFIINPTGFMVDKPWKQLLARQELFSVYLL